MNGPSHFRSSLPFNSVRVVLMTMMSPSWNSLEMTTLSLQLFVVAWYLFRASRAWAQFLSRRYFVVSLSMSRTASGSDRGEPYLSSCRVIASAPYTNLNGVKPVAREIVVFSPQSTSGNWSAHSPFFVLKESFLDYCENLSIFALDDSVRLWMIN